jgi:hypothetical protein
MSANLAGLRIKLNSRCWCGCNTARIAESQWRNAPLCCDGCDIERGRLNETTQRFITEFIKLIGRPTSPIEITEPSLQPSGATAATSSSAPTNAKTHGV